MGDTRAILEQLISFDTTSRNSNLALVDWAVDRFQHLGARVRLTFDDERTKANILASLGPAEVPGIVLSGHTDVVPVDDQQWSSDPFVLREDNGRLYGRGTADMKGFLACCMAAAAQIATRKLHRPVHFAFSYDEEVGCLGVSRLVQDLLAAECKPAFAIVGEPTAMRIGNGHRGFFGYETRFRGKAAHSSDPSEGTSAIYPAAAFATFIQMLGAEKNLSQGATFNVGRIEGGSAINIVPSRCDVVWEFRPKDDSTMQDILAAVETYLQTQTEPPTTTLLACVPPLMQNADAVAFAAELGGQLPAHDLPFGTEGGFFDEAGIATVVCGPGTIAQAHQPDEWIAVEQLAECDRFLQRIANWSETPLTQ